MAEEGKTTNVPKPTDFLTSKFLNVPVWVWGLAGLGIAYWYNRRQAAKNAANTQNTQDTTGTGQTDTGLTPAVIVQDFGGPVTQTQTQSQTQPQAASTAPKASAPTPPVATNHPIKLPKKTPPQKEKGANGEPIFNATYTVKKGQTLEEVAKQFGITREELAHANGFGTGAGLRTGQKLKVPSPAPGGKPNPAP